VGQGSSIIIPASCKTDTGKPPFKASEGGCFENLRVSEDITPSEFQQGKGTRVPIRPKVRLEASPNGLPMSVSSKVYATLRYSERHRKVFIARSGSYEPPPPNPPPSRDCVVIMREGRFRRDRRSSSSTLECGRLTPIERKICRFLKLMNSVLKAHLSHLLRHLFRIR